MHKVVGGIQTEIRKGKKATGGGSILLGTETFFIRVTHVGGFALKKDRGKKGKKRLGRTVYPDGLHSSN